MLAKSLNLRKHRPRERQLRKLILEALEPRSLLSASPELLIGHKPATENAKIHSSGYFSHHDPIHGFELWKTDGTAGGTRLVKDLNPHGSSNPENFVEANGTVYFVASDAAHGKELWKTDGSQAGTVLVADLEPGPGSFFVDSKLASFGSKVVFTTTGSHHMYGVWITDGSAEGTVQLSEFGGLPMIVKDFAYFVSGLNLMKTDGTVAGTEVVKTLSAPSAEPLFVFRNELYFHDSGLWKTDGTPSGTVFMAPVRPADWSNAGEVMYFVETFAQTSKWWRTDGTVEGTFQIPQIPSQRLSSLPSSVMAMGDQFYLVADDGIHGEELWSISNATGRAQMVKEIRPSSEGANISFGLTTAGFLYFTASDGVRGNELWRTDGTEHGTTLFLELSPGSDGLSVWEFAQPPESDDFFFTVMSFKDHRASDLTLWRSDGTQQGTFPLSIPGVDQVRNLVAIGSDAVFNTFDDGGRFGRGRSDGTLAGTYSITSPIHPWNINDFEFGETRLINGTLFAPVKITPWNARDDKQLALAVSDGTPYGTKIVKTISTEKYANLSYLNEFDGQLLFGYRNELWLSDGTEDGTRRIQTFDNWIRSVRVAASGEAFLIVGSGFADPFELWKTDGTELGTIRIYEFPPTVQNEISLPMWEIQGTIFFSIDDVAHGTELWTTDGTTSGTRMVKDVAPGDSDPQIVGQIGERILFLARHADHGMSLWQTDGTADGTTLIKGTVSFQAQTSNDILFLSRGSKPNTELWSSDGTTEGTQFVRKGFYGGLGVIGNEFFFACYDLEHGIELWKSDGTREGTMLLKDLVPGPTSAFTYGTTSSGTTLGNELFFITAKPDGDKELWKTNGTESGTVPLVSTPDTLISNITATRQYLHFDVRTHQTMPVHFRSDGTPEGTVPLAAGGTPVATGGSEFLVGSAIWQVPASVTNVTLKETGGVILIGSEQGQLVIRHNGEEVFSAASQDVGELNLVGSDLNEVYIIDLASDRALPPGGLNITGNGAANSGDVLVLSGGARHEVYYRFEDLESGVIDIDGEALRFSGFGVFVDKLTAGAKRFASGDSPDALFLGDDGDPTNHYSRLHINSSTIDFINPLNELTVIAGAGKDSFVVDRLDPGFRGQITVRDIKVEAASDALRLGPEWHKLEAPMILGVPFLVACSGGVSLQAPAIPSAVIALPENGSTDWQNEFDPFDVDASGEVSPTDVLTLINALNDPIYLDPHSNRLFSKPKCMTQSLFLDVNGDEHFTAADVLLVINHIHQKAVEPRVASARAAAFAFTLPPHTVRDAKSHFALGIHTDSAQNHTTTSLERLLLSKLSINTSGEHLGVTPLMFANAPNSNIEAEDLLTTLALDRLDAAGWLGTP